MFFGQWEYTINKNNRRVVIPKQFRKEFGNGNELIVALIDDSIRIYPLEKAKKLPSSQIWIVKQDQQGRIVIPIRLKRRLKIGRRRSRKIILYGQRNYFEIRLE